MNKIDNTQMRCIYGCAKKQGLDNDALHQLVYAETKQEHISKLSYEQAEKVIKRLNGRAGKSHVKRQGNSFGRRQGMASDAQINKLYALMYQLAEFESKYSGADVGARLLGLAKKHCGVDHLKFLTRSDANSLIEIIKKMIDTKKRGLQSEG